MGNIITSIGHGIKVAGEDLGKVIVDIVSDGEKVVKVIETAEKLTPEFKADLKVVIDDIQPIAAALAPALATGGSNVSLDVSALVAVAPEIIKLVKDFLVFVPALQEAIKELGSDVSTPAAG